MTLREFFVQRLKAETPAFLKVLKALPADQISYKPHENSPSAGQLAWTITAEMKTCSDLIADGKAEWKDEPAPPLAEIQEKFERWSRELADKASQTDDEAWKKSAPFMYQGKVVSERPIGEFIWFVLFDCIHHRGQLAAYLRPMGGKVPSIYGPSADDKGSGANA